MERREIIRAAIGFAVYLFMMPAILFLSAGTLNWPMAWLYVGLLMVSTVGSRLIVLKSHPETLRERARFTASEGVEPWDRGLVAIGALFGPMAAVLVAGLDQRLGWSKLVPIAGQYLAGVVIAIGYGLAFWAMVVNQYFSAVARIQRDRGQSVVMDGPYRVVRHPAYLGGILGALAFPFMLDAIWALVPAVVIAAVLIIRTILEDRMLRAGLEGYLRYMERVRYRLIPGIW